MRTRSSVAAAALAVAFSGTTPARSQDGVAPPGGAPFPGIIYPDDELLLPEGFTITREVRRQSRDAVRTAPDPAALNLPREVADRLSACWTPPPVAPDSVAQVTVRLSFTKGGAVIGTPATPFLQAGDDAARRALRASLLDAIRTCTPLRFTASLGRAIAGRIFAIRFIVHHADADRRT